MVTNYVPQKNQGFSAYVPGTGQMDIGQPQKVGGDLTFYVCMSGLRRVFIGCARFSGLFSGEIASCKLCISLLILFPSLL